MKRRIIAWATFAVSLGLLVFVSASRESPLLSTTYRIVSLTLILVLSCAKIADLWRVRKDPRMRQAVITGSCLPGVWRRWKHGEQ